MPTAMITGAGGGLGAAIADALAPTHTLFLAGRPSARLDAVAERLGATTWPMDLADPDAIEAVVEPIVELDVLIHNAGVAYPGRVAESTRRRVAGHHGGQCRWRRRAHAGAAARAARRGGHVVFINSGAGHQRVARAGVVLGEQVRAAGVRRLAAHRRARPAGHLGAPGTDRHRHAGRDLVAYEGREYGPAQFLQPETVAQVVAEAVNAPPDADIHEVIVRPAR